jgi:hypothetical protein
MTGLLAAVHYLTCQALLRPSKVEQLYRLQNVFAK